MSCARLSFDARRFETIDISCTGDFE